MRIAAANQPERQQPAGQPITLYGQGLNNTPSTVQQQQPPEPQPQRVHVGHAEPANRIIPFFLPPEEQRELDEFLIRWEKYSTGVKRYDVDFNMFIYDSTIPGAEANKPYKVTYGYFKYVANPMRFVYHVEGEWQSSKQIKRDGDKNPNIFAEMTIIDEKSVYRYDYNSKTVVQINVPPEMIGRGIADSPLPLIFGAKADELKRRFSMKIVSTSENDTRVWLQARPLLIEDQQEFKQIDILLDKKTLQAQGLQQWDINEKAYKVFQLISPKTNDRLNFVLDDLKRWFTPEVPRGWKHEVSNWILPQQARPQPRTASPVPNRNEIPLY
jgi:TIGR03009 family protein